MAKKFQRKDDGKRFVMAGHGLVRPGKVFDSIPAYYATYFEEIEVEDAPAEPVKASTPPEPASEELTPEPASGVSEPEPEPEPEPVAEADEDYRTTMEPFGGYDDETARDLADDVVVFLGAEELRHVIVYEEANKGRVTVLRAARSALENLEDLED